MERSENDKGSSPSGTAHPRKVGTVQTPGEVTPSTQRLVTGSGKWGFEYEHVPHRVNPIKTRVNLYPLDGTYHENDRYGKSLGAYRDSV